PIRRYTGCSCTKMHCNDYGGKDVYSPVNAPAPHFLHVIRMVFIQELAATKDCLWTVRDTIGALTHPGQRFRLICNILSYVSAMVFRLINWLPWWMMYRVASIW